MDYTYLKNIEIQDFSSESIHKTFLLNIQGRFFEIGQDTATLLIYLKNNGTDNTVLEAYVRENKDKVSIDNIKDFLDDLGKTIHKIEKGTSQKSFLYSRDIIPSFIISKLSKSLYFLFNKWSMISICLLFIILEYFYFTFPNFGNEDLSINIYTICCLFLFFIFSSLFHELGHASACQYFGLEHGNIGFALYMNFPVFYTDVSNIWKLSRSKRCIVNISGVYFQILLLIPLLIGYFHTNNALLNFIIVTTNLNLFITLNPFFKFDGYWMMTDILGIANLRKKGNEAIKYLLRRLFRKPVNRTPYLFTLNKGAKIGVAAYTFIVNCFFAYYFFYLIPMFLISFYKTFPIKFQNLLTQLSQHQLPDWQNIQQLLIQILFIGLILYMIYKIFTPFIKRGYKKKE